MNKEEIILKIKNQRDNLVTSNLKDYRYRVELLKKLKSNIIEMEEEIATALKLDLNKSRQESYMCEIGMVLSEITYMIKHLKYFAKIKRAKTPLSQFHAKSYVVPCAYGSVLIVSPWNYPFMLCLDPLVDAISAGNSVVVKPSITSKNTALVIEKLISKTFDEKDAFVVIGGRADCDFLFDQKFDYIFFTGSANVGKMIMEKASKNFTPVTLELGGKSPCVVDNTADIKLTAKRLVWGKFLNAGQTCVAPDFLYCQKDIKDELVEEIKNQIKLQFSASPLDNEDYPKIINEKQFKSIICLINDKKVIYGGKNNIDTLKIEPTIVNADFNDKSMQSEIFGPVLPVVTFDTIDEAISTLNSRQKPLAFYVFTSKKSNAKKFINSCDFGGGCINDVVIHLATNNMPFGGVGESGLGAYHGKFGFDTFTHYKSIVDKKTWIDMNLRYQPYSKRKEKMISFFLK